LENFAVNLDTVNTPQSGENTDPAILDRRRFLARLSVALGAFAATLLGIPVVGFLLSPLLRRPPEIWRSVGAIENFTVGQTTEVVFLDASPLPWAGVTAKTAAWLRRESDRQFIAFSLNCTHLGCPVRWLPRANLFICPCHGGVYNKDGAVAAGPPPEPLVHYPVRVQNGQVEIRTSPVPIT
jgi:menaquinol-cytochrome c reductase iron-sulfur subunit